MAYEVPESDLPPVTDWLHDWDWLDDQWGANAIDIWNEVRAVCPVATTERYGRAFMPVTYEAVAQVAHDTEHFSSIFVSVARPDVIRRPAPPITSDPPDHHGHRRLLLPSFSPKVIAPMEQDMREFCRGLIAGHRRLRCGRRVGDVRPAHPRARHLRPARRSGVGCGHVPRLDLPQLPAVPA